MKPRVKSKTLATALTAMAICATTGTALADDFVYNNYFSSCRVATYDSTGKVFYIQVYDVGGTKYLRLTSSWTSSTKFNIARKDTMKDDANGVAYYLSGVNKGGGGCVGLPHSSDPVPGQLVRGGVPCDELSAAKHSQVVFEAIGNDSFRIRVANTTLYLGASAGIADGKNIYTMTRGPSSTTENRTFYTNSCRNIYGEYAWPKLNP